MVKEAGKERQPHQTRTHFWEDSNKHLLTGEVLSCQNKMWKDISIQGLQNPAGTLKITLYIL